MTTSAKVGAMEQFANASGQTQERKKTSMEELGRCANWVYVVLSRVRTRKGLFLTKTKPLDLERDFNVPESLIDFENRIRTNLEQPTLDTLTQKGYYRPGPEGTHNTE
eukprot:scaffold737_cov127-Skeletonema_marinoi.AAC.1